MYGIQVIGCVRESNLSSVGPGTKEERMEYSCKQKFRDIQLPSLPFSLPHALSLRLPPSLRLGHEARSEEKDTI